MEENKNCCWCKDKKECCCPHKWCQKCPNFKTIMALILVSLGIFALCVYKYNLLGYEKKQISVDTKYEEMKNLGGDKGSGSVTIKVIPKNTDSETPTAPALE